MAKQKHHVFSARTTEEGLRLLNGLRRERKVGWDDLVIDAVCDRYGLDKAVMALPKTEKPAKEAENNQQPMEQTAEETPAKKQDKKK